MGLLRMLPLALAALAALSCVPLASATTDCSLRSLKLETSFGVVALQPAFGRTIRSYKAVVPYEAEWVKLTAVTYQSSTLLRMWYQYASGADGVLTDIGGVSMSGDVSSPISIIVGVNKVGVKVKCDCALTYVIEVTREPCIYTKGDPDFAGLLGQQYQVHGVAGEVYNVISDRTMQMNSRFVFLDQGDCPILNGRRANACWSHPGSYLGEIGIKTCGGDRLHIASGSAQHGFNSVTLNGRELEFDEVLPLRCQRNDGENQRLARRTMLGGGSSFETADGETSVSIGAGSDQLAPLSPSFGDDYWVVRNSTHLVTIRLSNFLIQIENSDQFVNYRLQVTDWSSLPGTHGLLGQTYRHPLKPGKQVKEIEGNVDDYQIEGSSLWGDEFVFNRFGI